MTKSWDHKQFASPSDPVHKSDLSDIQGQYGCSEKFRRKRSHEAESHETRWSEKVAVGNVVHGVADRALSNPASRAEILAGRPLGGLERVIDEECTNEAGRYPDDRVSQDSRDEALAMVRGLFESIPKHVKSVIAVEASFAAPVGDKHWSAGHIDILYEPLTGGVGEADWKTGSQKPSLITLAHGFESGFYSNAVERGWFLHHDAFALRKITENDANGYSISRYECTGPTSSAIATTRAEARRLAANLETVELAKLMASGAPIPEYAYTIGKFPSEIYTVHLRDYVPYEKKGSKTVSRPEDCEHFGVSSGTKVQYEKGQMRGGGWQRNQRNAEDGKRLVHLFNSVARMVRMGIFVPVVGDNCERCKFKAACLTDGYALQGADAKQAQQALRGLDVDNDGLSEFAA